MAEIDNHIFEKYDKFVRASVGELTKARAQALSSEPSPGLVSQESMRQFYESLDCIGWERSVGSNWVWRYKEPRNTDSEKSKEVLLERAVAVSDKNLWACQMSTSSGVEGPYLHRRRAIDLVRYIDQGQYAFVELKVGSDNPLYAAFEILGYALAYLHAKKAQRWLGDGEHNVFDADQIELTILGPEIWYRYGTGKKFEYSLDWLLDEISESLNGFVEAECSGSPRFSMAFRKFCGDDRDQQAKSINEISKTWRPA